MAGGRSGPAASRPRLPRRPCARGLARAGRRRRETLVQAGHRRGQTPRVSWADMSRDRFWRGEPVSAARWRASSYADTAAADDVGGQTPVADFATAGRDEVEPPRAAAQIARFAGVGGIAPSPCRIAPSA